MLINPLLKTCHIFTIATMGFPGRSDLAAITMWYYDIDLLIDSFLC